MSHTGYSQRYESWHTSGQATVRRRPRRPRRRMGCAMVVATIATVLGFGSVTFAVNRYLNELSSDKPDPAADSDPSPTWQPRQVTILGSGDILVHPPVWAQAREDSGGSGYDFSAVFAHASDTISGADLALCHLEAPIAAAGSDPSGYPSFNAPAELLNGLHQAGFDGCSTASDHVIDRGADGIARTLDAMDEIGLGHAGSARSAEEAAQPTLYDVADTKIAHLSYTAEFSNGGRPPSGKDWLANRLDAEAIEAEAAGARAAGAEIVVLSIHWGLGYQHEPSDQQIEWAQQLLAVPDIDFILGHHARVVQPMERIGDKWVAYDLGIGVARDSDPFDARREGVLARITMTETSRGEWHLSKAEAVPLWMQVSPQVRLIDLAKALDDPASTTEDQEVCQAAMIRIAALLRVRGAERAGLVVVGAGGGNAGGTDSG